MFGCTTRRAEGIMIGYTTWGPIRGGCDHVHETAEGGVRCLEKDREALDSSDQWLHSDRRLHRLVLCPPDEMTPRPLMREDHEVLSYFGSLW
jgi:hypothetical protein